MASGDAQRENESAGFWVAGVPTHEIKLKIKKICFSASFHTSEAGISKPTVHSACLPSG